LVDFGFLTSTKTSCEHPVIMHTPAGHFVANDRPDVCARCLPNANYMRHLIADRQREKERKQDRPTVPLMISSGTWRHCSRYCCYSFTLASLPWLIDLTDVIGQVDNMHSMLLRQTCIITGQNK